ncbi:MAG: hypothetical protein IJY57_04820 [Clostridia bacterium]|nr:hypothetical protein [Clostridia bacterium]
MKSIVLIIPYFGKLPYYFDLWKASAKHNSTIDFMFFTDIPEIEEDGNIKVVKISFNDFANKFKDKFDFNLSLNSPYKLCDFRMAYGYVLQEYIKNYDFWGHCDIDLIFGDIRSFITEDVLNANDKILEHGHFTLYRNTEEVNTLFMKEKGFKDYDYKYIFATPESMYFDEIFGARWICRKLNVPTYLNKNAFFDVLEKEKEFTHISDDFSKSVFKYDNGKLFALSLAGDKTQEKEIMYAHFQKRKMDYSAYIFGEKFYIVPNKLVLAKNVKSESSLFKVKGKRLYKLKKKIEHIKTYLNRYFKGNYKSFKAYRKERKAFRLDMINAKNELKKWEN